LQTIARAQVHLGATVRVICVNHRDRFGQDVTWNAFARTPTVEEKDREVEVLRVGRRASLFRLDICPALCRLGRTLREWMPDIVHLHVPNPTMLLALVPTTVCHTLVITHHSDVVRQRKLGLAMRPFEKVIYHRARRIVAASPPYAESSPWLKRLSDCVHIVPYGIDLHPFTHPRPTALAAAQHLRESHGEPLWLCVGRLVYYKGLSTALEAMRGVPGRLLIIGEGPLLGQLAEESRRLGVEERVRFLGRKEADELIGAYHAATAFWFPSNARSEAFGIVQLEAMACGCPVINTAIPGSGVSWASRDDESGLTIPVGDATALARAARRLLEEPGLRQRLAAGARCRAEKDFDAQTMARRMFSVYEQALTRTKSCPR
jgi:rhamnosyl/mannosyltransferase